MKRENCVMFHAEYAGIAPEKTAIAFSFFINIMLTLNRFARKDIYAVVSCHKKNQGSESLIKVAVCSCRVFT